MNDDGDRFSWTFDGNAIPEQLYSDTNRKKIFFKMSMKTVIVKIFEYQILVKVWKANLIPILNEVGIFKSQPGTGTRCSTIILKLYPKTGSEYCFLIYFQCYTCTFNINF